MFIYPFSVGRLKSHKNRPLTGCNQEPFETLHYCFIFQKIKSCLSELVLLGEQFFINRPMFKVAIATPVVAHFYIFTHKIGKIVLICQCAFSFSCLNSKAHHQLCRCRTKEKKITDCETSLIFSHQLNYSQAL